MANRNAAKGTRFEHMVRRELQVDGGFFVMRSPASLSVIDLLAVNREDVLFVQCKTNGRLDPAEWNALFDTAIHFGGTPLLAHRKTRGRTEYLRLIGRKVGPVTRTPPCEVWHGWPKLREAA